MWIFASERSDEEKKEIYDKWKSLINMSKKELVEWGKDPDHLEASLNREEAKDNGKIQSGYDSFHRIKRRKDKPFEDWTAQDFDNASQENGFNGRMLGGKPGKPVGSTGMSKWEISLRNWGHDPSKSNSPSYDKWKSWKKQNEEEIKMSLAKKKKASLVSDLHKMSFKVKGGENLRVACLQYMKYTQNIKVSTMLADEPIDLSEFFKESPKTQEIVELALIDEIQTIVQDITLKLKMTTQKGNLLLSKKDMPSFGNHNLSMDSFSPRQKGNVFFSEKDIPSLGNQNLNMDYFSLPLVKVIQPEVNQVIANKSPLLFEIAKAHPIILGILTGAVLTYIYTKNSKVIKNFIKELYKKTRNLGDLFMKALKNGYKWILPHINNLIMKRGEFWEKTKEYASKGFELAKEYGIKGFDKAMWLKDNQLYGKNTANYLQVLRNDDREKSKLLEDIKNTFISRAVAKKNLIRTAFDLNPKLGRYVLNNI